MQFQPLSDEEFEWFLKQLNTKFGIDLSGYKPHRVKRRTEILLKKYKCGSFSEYIKLLSSDEEKKKEFVDRMTINVTEFFRNPEKWWQLRDKYLPILLKNHNFKAWSAGCSSGEEPYSLSILLEELRAPKTAKIVATDIDMNILVKAKQGIYEEQNLINVPQNYLQKYFKRLDGNKYQVSDIVKSRVQFKYHNMLKDPFDRDYDLILCRNVVIYFESDAKKELYRNFANSLKKGGMIFVGATERIFDYKELGLELVESFFYKKV